MSDLRRILRLAGVLREGHDVMSWPDTEMVPLRWLNRFPGNAFRDNVKINPPHMDNEYGSLDDLIQAVKKDGILAPLCIYVGFRDRRAYLGEGTHRREVANRLGIVKVPATVLIEETVDALESISVADDLLIGRSYRGETEASPSRVFRSLSPR